MEPNKNELIIAEFSEYPGPRYCSQGDSSGESFYFSELNTAFASAIRENKKLIVSLDGTAGYASSFLDQAFGNLIYDFSLEVVKKNLVIVSKQEPDWKEMILNETFNEWEQRRIKNTAPIITENHSEWFRMKEGKIISKVWFQL